MHFHNRSQKSQLKKGRRRKTPELKSNGWLRRSRIRDCVDKKAVLLQGNRAMQRVFAYTRYTEWLRS